MTPEEEQEQDDFITSILDEYTEEELDMLEKEHEGLREDKIESQDGDELNEHHEVTE